CRRASASTCIPWPTSCPFDSVAPRSVCPASRAPAGAPTPRYRRRLPPMFAVLPFAQVQLGVLTTLPMDQDPQRLGFHVHHDLLDHRPDDPLLQVEERSRVVPQPR